MSKNSISWKEGMFLLPHHFQRQEEFHSAELARSSFVSAPNNYGFRELTIDMDALQNWELLVTRALGRTKSGTLFHFGEGDIPRLDLNIAEDGNIKSDLDGNKECMVHLSFSANQPNTKNVSDNGNSRYHEYEQDVFDIRNGSDDKPIVFKKLRGALTTKTRSTDHEYLQLAAIVKGGNGPVVQPQYFPPSTVTLASNQSAKFFQQIADELESYLKGLLEQLKAGGIHTSLMGDPEQSEQVYRFTCLSELHSRLSLLKDTSVHPFDAYQKISEFIGRMTIIDPEKEYIVNYPRYDHDDSYSSLSWAWDRILRHFKRGTNNIRRFDLINELMTENGRKEIIAKKFIPPEYFADPWKLYLLIDYRTMTSDDAKFFVKAFRDLADVFYWKLGADGKVNEYFDNRDRGVKFGNLRLKDEADGLSRKDGFLYADFDRDTYWNPVKDTGTLCFRVQQNQLVTPHTDLGDPDITVRIGKDGRTYKFQLAVIAVRSEQQI